MLSLSELKELASELGVKYDNASKSGKLYKTLHKMKFPGFKKGGIARLVKNSGEDGLALARNGEGFIAPEHVSQIQELLTSVPVMTDLTQSLVKLPDTSHLVPAGNIGNHDINIDLGGITMYGVNDPKEFSKQLVHTIQNDQKVRKTIRASSTDLLAGAGRLSVNQIL